MIGPLAPLLLLVGSAAPLHGRVVLDGPAPAPKALPVTQDASACGKSVPDESFRVDATGGLADAIVSVDDPPDAGPRASALTLDQAGCRFEPHVLVARVGSTLTALNSDPVLHTVHAWPASNRDGFDLVLPFQGARRTLTLIHAGLFEVTCSAGHGWMHAWLRVFDHGYFARTDAHGEFALPPLPKGHYTLSVWHEGLPVRTVAVTVGDAAAPLTVPLSAETK